MEQLRRRALSRTDTSARRVFRLEESTRSDKLFWLEGHVEKSGRMSSETKELKESKMVAK